MHSYEDRIRTVELYYQYGKWGLKPDYTKLYAKFVFELVDLLPSDT